MLISVQLEKRDRGPPRPTPPAPPRPRLKSAPTNRSRAIGCAEARSASL